MISFCLIFVNNILQTFVDFQNIKKRHHNRIDYNDVSYLNGYYFDRRYLFQTIEKVPDFRKKSLYLLEKTLSFLACFHQLDKCVGIHIQLIELINKA